MIIEPLSPGVMEIFKNNPDTITSSKVSKMF